MRLFPPEVYNDHYYPMCVLYLWAAGHRLGQDAEDCVLSVPAGTLLNQWRRRGTLRDAELQRQPAEQAFARFWQARYTENAKHDDHVDYLRWARLEVCPLGEQAHDGWVAILLEEPDKGRFIWRGPDSDVIREAPLRPREFHEVVIAFLAWLSERSPWFRRHYEANRDAIPPGE